jgi:hypothetical protein
MNSNPVDMAGVGCMADRGEKQGGVAPVDADDRVLEADEGASGEASTAVSNGQLARAYRDTAKTSLGLSLDPRAP